MLILLATPYGSTAVSLDPLGLSEEKYLIYYFLSYTICVPNFIPTRSVVFARKSKKHAYTFIILVRLRLGVSDLEDLEVN